MTKMELVKNIHDLIEHYRSDLQLEERGVVEGYVTSLCKTCWKKETRVIESWVYQHLAMWRTEA